MQKANPVNLCGNNCAGAEQLVQFDRSRPFEKTVITWVGVSDGVQAEVRLYDRLFLDAQPDAGGKDFIESPNPSSLKVVTAIVQPSLAHAKAGETFQFGRLGYFVADRVDHAVGTPVFNLTVGLNDRWGN